MRIKRGTGVVCIALLLLASCKKNEAHIPAPRMQQILLDIHVAEAWSTLCVQDSTQRHTSREKNMDSLALYYRSIFKHYNITREEFNSSMHWYQVHPDELDSVYNNMIPDLSKMEGMSQAGVHK